MKNKRAKITSENLKNVYRMVYKMNKMQLRLRDNQTLLHLAVNAISPVDDFYMFLRFPCVDTVKLLLHCGASVECFDFGRNTPLHTLAATFPTYRPVSSEMAFKAEEIIRLFIDAGIHLDVVNCEGATAAKICPLRKLLK
jgi:Fem-1 homolog b